MRIESVSGGPPWAYGPPGNLAAPAAPLSFRTFLERLALFSRDGLLDMGSRVLWYPWLHELAPSGERGHVVTETFGPDVLGLAMMFSSTTGGVDAEELDFRLLCWELFELGSFAPFESAEAAAERALLSRRWTELLGATPFGRLDPTRNVNHVRGLWMRGRAVATELLSLPSAPDAAARLLVLHEALEAEAPAPEAYREFRRVYFQNEPIHLLQHALGLIGLVTKQNAEEPRCPGRFDVFGPDEGHQDVVDFTQFGRLACVPSSELPAAGQRLLAMGDHERKLSPTARPLTFRPGLILDDIADRRAFCYPSPRRLLLSLHRLFIDDFIDFLAADARFGERVGVPAPSLLGRALHRSLGETLGADVLVIDDADCPVEGKKPDAIWCGERYGVIFEAKTRVTPRVDPDCCSPDSLLEAWRRCWEAVEQASEFIRHDRARRWLADKTGRSPEVWVVAIVVDEHLVGERTSFRHATSHWNLLTGTGLSGVAVVSVGCVETVTRGLIADDFGRAIERAWTDAGADGLQQPDEEPPSPTIDRPPHLERAFQRLLNTG